MGDEGFLMERHSFNEVSRFVGKLNSDRARWPRSVKNEFWDLVRWLNQDARDRSYARDGVSPWALQDAERAIRETYSTGGPQPLTSTEP